MSTRAATPSSSLLASFGSLLRGSLTGEEERVLPFVVPMDGARGYRDAPKRQVTFKRCASCVTCKQRGCKTCAYVGWVVKDERPDVTLPRDAGPGTRVALDGQRDEFGPFARPIFVEVVEPGPRALALGEEQRRYEQHLIDTWGDARRAKRTERGARRVSLLLLFGVPVVFGVQWFFGDWLPRGALGAKCAQNADCRSAECLPRERGRDVSVEGHELFVEAVPGAGFCTTACSVDADCPASMRCGPAELRRGVPGMSPMLASGERALRCLPPDPQGP